MENWKVLIACASEKDIHPEYYEEDPLFLPSKKYVFFNVGKERFSHPQFEVVNVADIPGYQSLGRKYAESEIIYNIRKLNLFSDKCDYLGLMHYDFNFLDSVSLQTNVTALIDGTIKSGIDFVSFFSGPLASVIGHYNVLFDERKPNCLFCRDSGLPDPKSINDKIVADIKRVLGFDFNSIMKPGMASSKVALCCSFLAKREIFDQAADLIVDLIDSHCLDGFDTEDRHRYPGQVAERYIAFFSLFFKKACFKLDHKFIGGNADLHKAWNAENY